MKDRTYAILFGLVWTAVICLVAFRLAKIELKKLGAPRHQLKMFVDVIMRDMKANPERYQRDQNIPD